jgi:DNA-binding NarL/FixJ family response regulator
MLERRMETRTKLARVLAVDDHEVSRASIRQIVNATAGLELIAEADSGEAAVAAAAALRPDLVLMDVRMPGIGGIEACRRVKGHRPSTVVILVSSTHPDEFPCAHDCRADCIVWKVRLRPALLADLWSRHCRGG